MLYKIDFLHKVLFFATFRKFYELDAVGVHPFVTYSDATGGFCICVYRRKTKEESSRDSDWKMVRHGHVGSFNGRRQAEIAAIELAIEIGKKYNYIK